MFSSYLIKGIKGFVINLNMLCLVGKESGDIDRIEYSNCYL